MDYILPNEAQMEKMAEEYAKIKILKPCKTPMVETLELSEPSAVANNDTEKSISKSATTGAETWLLLCALQKQCSDKTAKVRAVSAANSEKQSAQNLFPFDFHGQIADNSAINSQFSTFSKMQNDTLFRQAALAAALNACSKNCSERGPKAPAPSVKNNDFSALLALSLVLFPSTPPL